MPLAPWQRFVGFLALAGLACALAYAGWRASHLVSVGDVRIDPTVKLRPDERYTVRVWEADLPTPQEPGAYREQVQRAVAALMQARPELEIKLEWIPWDTFADRLGEALAAGDPPDVAGTPGGPAHFDTDLQVPVDAYLDPTLSADILPQAWHAMLDGRRHWGFPRWIAPHFWLARRPSGEDGPMAAALRNGWALEQVAIAARAAGRAAPPLALNAVDAGLFFDLMAARGEPQPVVDGKLRWTADQLQPVAEALAAWAKAGWLPSDEKSLRNRIAPFLAGRSLILGPATSWLFSALAARDEAVEPLPIPGASADAVVAPGEVSAYVLFRQADFAGSRHTKAAAEVAQALSRGAGDALAARLHTVPAHPSALPHWLDENGLGQDASRRLIQLAERVAPAATAQSQAVALASWSRSELLPALRSLLSGTAAPDAFAAALAASLAPQPTEGTR